MVGGEVWWSPLLGARSMDGADVARGWGPVGSVRFLFSFFFFLIFFFLMLAIGEGWTAQHQLGCKVLAILQMH
jgi:hypothetical protein